MISARRIKVVHLVRTLNTGGLERVVLDLARHRSASMFDCCVVCMEERGELAPKFEDAGVPVVALGICTTSFAARVWTLARELRALRPDVLHTHNSGPHVNGAFAAKLARIPVLVHTKHGRNYVNDRKKVLQNRVASLLSSKVVCVSQDAACVARDIESVPDDRLLVIHNGIDIGRFNLNHAPMLSAGAIRAVHVARLNRVKDQETLLRAVRLVVDELPHFHLDIIGDGPAREAVQARCRELDLSAHVTFRGMRDDVPKFLARSDLFLLSSISEGISLTLLEAMAAGLPVVATDVGGNPEVVDPGNTGLLVPARNPAAMADAILRLCRSPEELRAMGSRGRRRVEKEFSVTSMVASYEDLYCRLLHRCAAPRSGRFPVAPKETALVAASRA